MQPDKSDAAVAAGEGQGGFPGAEIEVDDRVVIVVDVGGGAVLEKGLKNYKTIILKNTGHIPMLENPQETASYYVSYLKGKN